MDDVECTCKDLEMDNLHYADCPKLQELLNEEEHGNPQ